MAKAAPKQSPEVDTNDAAPTPGLANLSPAPGSRRARLRKGRGRASGAGKTCNRGHNGEGQRSGRSRKRGFEGGQMPLYRRVPKLDGFRQYNRKEWLELNLSDISRLFPDETQISYDLLVEAGLLLRKHDGLRVMGNGDAPKGLKLEAHHVTASAKEKIEAAGGTITCMAQ